MTFLHMDFAPVNVPIERRLQTLAIVAMIVTQAGSMLITPVIAFLLIFYTRFWWLCILYISWYFLFDRDTAEKTERRSEWVRSWRWWVYCKNYFPLKMVKLPWGELDPKRNYLFCYFPHGLFSTGAFLTLATNAAGFHELFPDHRPHIHTISIFFKFPFIRELGFWIGGLTVSAKSINHVLGKPEGGNVSGLVVGGAAEAYYCKPGLHKIVYKKRKGFIKIALKNGSPLVPVYCFGETDLYSQMEFEEGTFFNKFQKFVNRTLGFAAIIPQGRGIFQYSFGLLPRRRPITVVVGEPLDVEKTENPTQEQIDELHRKFEEKLIELFDSQKKNYLENYEHAHLEIS